MEFDMLTWYNQRFPNRELPELLPLPEPPWLDLGCGNNLVPGAQGYDKNNGWVFPRDPLPWAEGTVGVVWMHAFLHYLAIDQVDKLFREIHRVLRPGGLVMVVETHALSVHYADDPRRQTRWSEISWREYFNTRHYGTQLPKYAFRVHACWLAAPIWDNISVFTQIVKNPDAPI